MVKAQKPGGIHYLWHRFRKKFMNEKTGKWKFPSYRFMSAVDRFAEKNPEIKITYCDDDCHATSALVFIPHEEKGSYLWGITAVFIPQCSSVEPSSFFFYPGHLKELMDTLSHFAGVARKHGNRNLDSCWRPQKDRDDSSFKNMFKEYYTVGKKEMAAWALMGGTKE